MRGRIEARGAPSARSGLSKITFQIAELRDLIEDAEVQDGSVSAWSVGMHIQHCALSMSGIAKQLLGCDEKPLGGPTSIGWLVLKTRQIPRGGAQAPEGTIPRPDETPEALNGMLTLAATLVEQVPDIAEDSWFQHFALGFLTRDRALRFVEIHNEHHLAIIEDILKA